MMKKYDETFKTLKGAQDFIAEELVNVDAVKQSTIKMFKINDIYKVEWEEY